MELMDNSQFWPLIFDHSVSYILFGKTVKYYPREFATKFDVLLFTAPIIIGVHTMY
jgi:hypothetical protein